jgi:hypothetical protein
MKKPKRFFSAAKIQSSPPVYRFVVRLAPTSAHVELYDWQIGTACIFTTAENKVDALKVAKSLINRNSFKLIEYIEKSTLIESLVKQAEKHVWHAYLAAQRGIPFFHFQADDLVMSRKTGTKWPQMAKLDEAFIDKVVLRAFGERLDTGQQMPDTPSTADYKVGQLVIELKDLQEDRLDNLNTQKKIVEVLGGVRNLDTQQMNPEIRQKFLQILSKSVHKRIDVARNQVRVTLDRMNDPSLCGAVIILNSGYESVNANDLNEIANQYCTKSSTVPVAITISSWLETNGFDTEVKFQFSPHQSDNIDVNRLRDSFWLEVSELMSNWARSGFNTGKVVMNPVRPQTFELRGEVYFKVPQTIKSSLK